MPPQCVAEICIVGFSGNRVEECDILNILERHSGDSLCDSLKEIIQRYGEGTTP